MFKSILASLISFLLCGVYMSEANSVTYGLFIHYLMGSGEPVTLKSPELIELCKGWVGPTEVYGTPYENAVGHYTCRADHTAYDTYDFDLQKNTPKVLPLYQCITQDIGVMNIALCLVVEGYGKDFHLEITE